MEAAGELAQLLERLLQLLAGAARACARAPSGSSRRRRLRDPQRAATSVTSRCCAPSCRLRSSRRRSASPASTMRAREAVSCSRRLGVRERERDELREVGEPLLGVRPERLGLVEATSSAPQIRPPATIGAATADR